MSLATPASAPAGDCANEFFFQLEQRNGSSEAASRLLGFEQGRWGRLGGLAAALATETAAASSCASVDAQQDPQSEAAVTDPCCTFALLRRLFFFPFSGAVGWHRGRARWLRISSGRPWGKAAGRFWHRHAAGKSSSSEIDQSQRYSFLMSPRLEDGGVVRLPQACRGKPAEGPRRWGDLVALAAAPPRPSPSMASCSQLVQPDPPRIPVAAVHWHDLAAQTTYFVLFVGSTGHTWPSSWTTAAALRRLISSTQRPPRTLALALRSSLVVCPRPDLARRVALHVM